MPRIFSTKVLDTILNVVNVDLKIPMGVADITFPVSQYAKEWWKNEKAKDELKKAIETAEKNFIRESPNNKAAQILHDFSLKSEKDFRAIISSFLDHLSEEKITELAATKLTLGFENIVSKNELQKALDEYLPYLRKELIKIEGFREVISAATIQRIDQTTGQTLDAVKELNSKFDIFAEARESNPSTSFSAFSPEVIADFEELPEAGQLPPGSRILYHRNAIFTGRQNELKQLAMFLLSNPKAAKTKIAAVSGIGGVGKTQLAVEFCYLFGKGFYGVHWINASTEDLNAEIAACGREMALPNFPRKVLDQAEATLTAWQHEPSRLVILDNLENPKLLKEWLPRLNTLRILITTRRQKWAPDLGIFLQLLGPLPSYEALILLRKLSSNLDTNSDIELSILAERLGNLPLALDLAGRYLNAHPTVLAIDYVQRLQEHDSIFEHKSLIGEDKDSSPTTHEQNLATTFLLSYQQLGDNEVDKLAKTFFVAAGYLAPNIPIPNSPFYFFILPDDTDEIKKIEARQLHQMEDLTNDALFRLEQLGLITESLTMHPLLSEFSNTLDSDDSIFNRLTQIMATYSNALNMGGNYSDLIRFIPHLETLASLADEKRNKNAAVLWNNLGYYYQHSASNYISAYIAFEHALELDRFDFGEFHNDVGRDLNNLGALYLQIKDYHQAKQMLMRAKNIFENLYGNSDTLTITASLNLAEALRQMGEHENAQKILETAFELYQSQPEKAIMVTARLYNNLGGVYYALGELQKSKMMFENALKTHEEMKLNENPSHAEVLHNLATVCADLGNLPKAREYEMHALSIFEANLPPEHPHIQQAKKTLKWIKKRAGH